MKMQVKYPFAREETKAWLKEMEQRHPQIFDRIKASFKHIHDDTFLDPSRWIRDDITDE